MSQEEILAVVHEIIPEGRHGPYVVASNDRLGSITFALTGNVWLGDSDPEYKEVISIPKSKLRMMEGGWRAMEVSRIYPS